MYRKRKFSQHLHFLDIFFGITTLIIAASSSVVAIVCGGIGIKKDDSVAVLTLKGEGVALVNAMQSTEEILQKDTGICASIERVIMNKGTYPSFWKKS